MIIKDIIRINNLFYLLLSVLIISSYFLGFYLNEDAAGGGKIDLYDHEFNNIHLFWVYFN